MLGLARQLAEINRDKTQPPFRCRSCGGEEFKVWEPVDYSQWIEIHGYDAESGLWNLDYIDGRSGDGTGEEEFWCVNCDDSARSLEELVGMPRPDWVPLYTDSEALTRINRILSVDEWGVGMLEDICEIVRASGRIEHPDPHWDRH